MASLKRLLCTFRGHEEYLHFGGNRVYLECVTCGRQSPGWTVDPALGGDGTRPASVAAASSPAGGAEHRSRVDYAA